MLRAATSAARSRGNKIGPEGDRPWAVPVAIASEAAFAGLGRPLCPDDSSARRVDHIVEEPSR